MKSDVEHETLLSPGDESAEPRTIDTSPVPEKSDALLRGRPLTGFQPGELLNERFEIEELIQSGGMGDVYRARDRQMDGPVAVKTLRSGSASRERFAREAARLAEFQHPGIPRYIAHDLVGAGIPYLVMEWLDGVELSTYLRAASIGLRSGVNLVKRVAEVLAYAHHLGLIHRDIHPNNLFLVGADPEDVRVLDFGVARLDSSEPPLTAEGAQIGTPGYMAPEQIEGRGDVGPAADVFSLGCVLHEVITGQRAFYAPTVRELLARMVADHPPRPSELRSDVPPELDYLVASMLEKDPGRRPQDAAEVLLRLKALPRLDDRPPVQEEPQAPASVEQQVTSLILLRKEGAGTLERAARAAEPHRMRAHEATDDTIVIATYGHGTAGDHATQAARCALAVQKATRATRMALSTGLSQQVGGALSGRAFDSALVSLLLKDGASGEAVPGGAAIWLDENTAALLDSRFEVRGVEQGYLLRGMRETYEPARTVLGKKTRCVGRKRELTMLSATLEQSFQDGTSTSVLVTGPPGIGKTRLASEITLVARRSVAGVQVLRGGAESMTAGVPFGALSKALSRICRMRDTEPDSIRRGKLAAHLKPLLEESNYARVTEFLQELLGISTERAPSPQVEAARRDAVLKGDQIQRAVMDWIRAETKAHPVLLIIDDFHWGDLPTVKFVEAALRQLAEAPLVILALARPDVHQLFPNLWVKRGITELRLSGLSKRAGTEMIKEVLGEQVDAKVIERVLSRSQGNPFWVEELLRAENAGHGDRVPDRVVLLAQSRIEQQNSDERRLLKAASVFGRQFWSGGAEAVLGPASTSKMTDRVLRDLQEAEFIVEHELSRLGGETEFQFASGLLRDAAYSLLAEEEKENAHLRAAEWMEKNGDSDPLAVAMHFTLGGEPDRARRHYLRAAEQALSGDDLDAAISCAEEGLAAGAGGPDAVRLRLVFAEANKWRGDNAQAFRAAQAAFARAEEGTALWYRAAGEAAVAAGKIGKRETALGLAKELLESEPREGSEAAHGSALSRVATQLVLGGDLSMARGLLEAAHFDEARVEPDPQVLGFYCEAQAVLAGASEDPVGRITYAERAAEHFEDAGDLRNACLLRLSQGFAEVEFGANDQARTTLLNALQVAEQMGLSNSIPVANAQLGRVLVRLGEWEKGLVLLESASAAFDRQKNVRLSGMTRVYESEAHICQGNLDAALESATRAAGILQRMPPMLRVAQGLLASLHAHLAQSRVEREEALKIAHEALEELSPGVRLPVGESVVRLGVAHGLFCGGEEKRALDLVRAETARIKRLGAEMSDERAAQFLRGCPARACLLKDREGAQRFDYVRFLRETYGQGKGEGKSMKDSGETTTLAEVKRITEEPEPVLRNLYITQSYFRLSGEIASVVDKQNINWSTFACWASKTAGRSIRNEEITHHLKRELGISQGQLREVAGPLQKLLETFGLGRMLRAAAVETLKDVSEEIAIGNRKVYAELAPLFARFVDFMRRGPQEAQLAEFVDSLTAGPIEEGGQELLKRAFSAWFEASRAESAKVRAELILRANCQIGLHEQTRLQPHIKDAMDAPIQTLIGKKLARSLPFVLRGPFAALITFLARGFTAEVKRVWEKVATRYAMRLALPEGQEISLGEDLPERAGIFPPDLQVIVEPKTEALLERFDTNLSSTRGSGANNWADLTDRMGFIVELFRAKQQTLQMFERPFSQAQTQDLAQGRIPKGDL